jgi:hypothetical protein
MKAIVTEIQVGGFHTCHNLKDACEGYLSMLMNQEIMLKTKIHFTIQLPNGETKVITIRDEDNQTIAYGDFEGLPSFLDYAKEVVGE